MLFSPHERLQRALTNRFLVYTGTISYGLYLLHKIPFDLAKSFHVICLFATSSENVHQRERKFGRRQIGRSRTFLARKRIKFQGLPARICWLGYGERAQFGLAMNDLVKKGNLAMAIVIGSFIIGLCYVVAHVVSAILGG